MEFETRSGLPIELRAESDGTITVEGYAAVFDQPTDIGGIFTEVVAHGAFKSALQRNDDVEFLINHGGLPLARSTAGNLTMIEDDHGLKIRAQLDPSDPDVQRIVPKMRAGMLDQMSFAFQATGQRWDTPVDGPDVRTVTDVILYDVSIVNRGAYPQTTIALRARDAAREEAEREQEEARKAHDQQGYLKRKAETEQRFRNI
jgi:HK97 family phage prohead protease